MAIVAVLSLHKIIPTDDGRLEVRYALDDSTTTIPTAGQIFNDVADIAAFVARTEQSLRDTPDVLMALALAEALRADPTLSNINAVRGRALTLDTTGPRASLQSRTIQTADIPTARGQA